MTTLKQTRETLGLTQKQAGALVGADDRLWRRWESGEYPMPAAKMELFLLKAKNIRKAVIRKTKDK